MSTKKRMVKEPRRVANLSDASLMHREELRLQMEANTLRFQREREAQKDCHLGWDFYYNFNESSLGLPYESQLTLTYVHRSFMAQYGGAGANSGARSRQSLISFTRHRKNIQQQFRFSDGGDFSSSDEDQPTEQLESGTAASLLASYGGHVQWDLYFKDPTELKKSIIKLNVIVASAFMDPQLNFENLASMDTVVASIDTLTLSLAEDINKLLRKCRMMYQSYDENSHPSRSSLMSSALNAICEFLGISRLSLIGATLQPNPGYNKPKPASARPMSTYPKTNAHSAALASVNLPGGMGNFPGSTATSQQQSTTSMLAGYSRSTTMLSSGGSQKMTNKFETDPSSSSEMKVRGK